MKPLAGMRALAAAVLLATGMGAMAAEAYPPLLPPEAAVRGYFDRLPEIRAARERMTQEDANARRLRAGPYEWSAQATLQRRNEVAGPSYDERGIALSRPLRWFGKAGKDAALGDQQIAIAGYALEDAWHEAGRGFLKEWYGALREARSAALLQDQVALLEQQAEVVRKRVKAGDAPRIDLALAEAERERVVIAQRQAAQRAALAASALQQRYPGIQVVAPASLPRPEAVSGNVDTWVRTMLAHNHEIELANAEASLARLKAERSALDRMPDPTVGVHYMQERDRQERVTGVTISIPIPGGARSAQRDADAAGALVAEQTAQQLRDRVRRDATAVAMAAESTHENWQRQADLSERLRANAALVTKAYTLGEVPIGEALLARRQALEAAAAAESAQFDALEAQARLKLDAHLYLEPRPDDTHHQ